MTAETEVRGVIDAWLAAIRARDLDGVVANHADDVRWFDVPPPAELIGLEPYRESWQEFLGFLGERRV